MSFLFCVLSFVFARRAILAGGSYHIPFVWLLYFGLSHQIGHCTVPQPQALRSTTGAVTRGYVSSALLSSAADKVVNLSGLSYGRLIWEFPTKGGPNIDPKIVGLLL